MRSTVIWSFLSLVALSTASIVSGCDSDAKIAKSGVGESCDSSADCDDGLNCIQGACYKSSAIPGGEGGDGAGGSSVGPTPPVLGGEGESCTKRADCEDGLACLNQRCTAEATGEGGGGNNGPTLGGPGETCGLTSDCRAGLTCLPQDQGQLDVRAIGSNTVGVCAVTDNGLEPTGKTCGAECLEAADCCELPVELHPLLVANSCAQLADLLDGVNCDAANLSELNGARCFAQSTYCECAKNTWACENGSCEYKAACEKLGFNLPGGCPSYTRAGHTLVTQCDVEGAGKCSPVAGEPTCTTDASCTNKPVADSLVGELCAAGECTCYKDAGACYRKCAEDLDCPAAYTCDTKTKVCVSGASCTSDAQCVVRYNDVRYKCFDGTCDFECQNDRDCNYGLLTYGSQTRVCNDQKRCVAVGCSSDDDCGAATSGVRLFCSEIAVGDTAPGVKSAITD